MPDSSTISFRYNMRERYDWYVMDLVCNNNINNKYTCYNMSAYWRISPKSLYPTLRESRSLMRLILVWICSLNSGYHKKYKFISANLIHNAQDDHLSYLLDCIMFKLGDFSKHLPKVWIEQVPLLCKQAWQAISTAPFTALPFV